MTTNTMSSTTFSRRPIMKYALATTAAVAVGGVALAPDPRARALYLAPTKALGHDQLRAAHALAGAIPRLSDVAPTAYDGDSPGEVRRFARERSRWVFSNPDMIHLSMLRNHTRWALFLLSLIHISEPTRLLSISYAVF